MAMSTGLSFPLLKVSLATDPPNVKTISWQHETRDVRVLFDNYGAVSSHAADFPVLNIFQGNKSLERVDLAAKAREAAAAVRETANASANPLDNLQHQPLTILHMRQNRTLAICYHLPNSKLRRVQLRFEADRDFDRVLALLELLGCRPVPAQGRDRSTTLRNDSRPTSVSNIPERTHLPSFSHEGPAIDNRISSSSHLFGVNDRLYSSNYMPLSDRPVSHGYQPRSDDWRRPTSSLSLQPIREEQPYHEDPVMANIGGYTQRPRATSIRPESTVPMSMRPWSHGKPAAPQLRPSSSMSDITSAQLQHELDAAIPPRRELKDIERPPSKQSLASRDGQRLHSSSEHPELPRPSFINPPLVERSGPAALGRSELDVIADPFGERSAAAIAGSNAISKQAVGSSATKKKAKAVNATSAIQRPDTALSTSSATLHLSSSTLPTSSSRPTSPNKANMDRVHAALPSRATAIKSTVSKSSDKDLLAQYAAMNNEDRMESLERMIVEAIDDENFVRLCEDVSACWQRIGFDKQ